MNDDSGRVMTAFTEAVKVALEDRHAFLDKVRGGDENLRHKVEALLKAHNRIGNFWEESPAGDSVE